VTLNAEIVTRYRVFHNVLLLHPYAHYRKTRALVCLDVGVTAAYSVEEDTNTAPFVCKHHSERSVIDDTRLKMPRCALRAVYPNTKQTAQAVMLLTCVREVLPSNLAPIILAVSSWSFSVLSSKWLDNTLHQETATSFHKLFNSYSLSDPTTRCYIN
jgi:hypothetical protein